jgi:hypothetical protein
MINSDFFFEMMKIAMITFLYYLWYASSSAYLMLLIKAF